MKAAAVVYLTLCSRDQTAARCGLSLSSEFPPVVLCFQLVPPVSRHEFRRAPWWYGTGFVQVLGFNSLLPFDRPNSNTFVFVSDPWCCSGLSPHRADPRPAEPRGWSRVTVRSQVLYISVTSHRGSKLAFPPFLESGVSEGSSFGMSAETIKNLRWRH